MVAHGPTRCTKSVSTRCYHTCTPLLLFLLLLLLLLLLILLLLYAAEVGTTTGGPATNPTADTAAAAEV